MVERISGYDRCTAHCRYLFHTVDRWRQDVLAGAEYYFGRRRGSRGAVRLNVESDGHIDVAWTDISTGFVQVYFSHSTDSGATFSAPRDISNAATGSNGSGGAEEPFMAVDSGGNLNIIWTNYPVTPPYGPKTDVYYVRSTDGGSTFSNPENVTNVANMSPSLTAYAYQLSLDGTGNIDVFWTTGSATGFVTRSTDHG